MMTFNNSLMLWYFQIMGESGIKVAPLVKICLVCFVIPNTCIDQEVIVGLILDVGRLLLSLGSRLKLI